VRDAALVSFLVLLIAGCFDESAPTAAEAEAPPRASFVLSGRIIGPEDDDSDIELTLKETNGVAAELNFIRLTCGNHSAQEWGANSFVSERGTNRIEGGSTLVFRRHYHCPASGRPQTLLADLTDGNGVHYRVEGAPYFPGWPGT
jgi:hypothetical protein